MSVNRPPWDPQEGTAGGPVLAAGIRALAAERGLDEEQLAAACGVHPADLRELLAGERRVGVSALARLVRALRSKPIEFLQRTGILSLEAYAGGLDPLYFLPEGPIRYEARIYMREINPRHAVPEGDMTKRNPTLAALAGDPVLDALGKTELELAYLLRAAAQQSGTIP